MSNANRWYSTKSTSCQNAPEKFDNFFVLVVVAYGLTILIGSGCRKTPTSTSTADQPAGHPVNLKESAARTAAHELLAAADQAAKNIIDPQTQGFAYMHIGKLQAAAGDVAGVRQTTKHVPVAASLPTDARVSKDQTWLIAEAQANAGDVAGVKATIASIPSAVPTTIPSTSPSKRNRQEKRANDMILMAQINAGNFVDAMATAAQMDDKDGDKIKFCFAIFEAQTRAGDSTGADQRQRILKAVVSQRGENPTTYVRLAKLQAVTGDSNGAAESIALAQKAAAAQLDNMEKGSSAPYIPMAKGQLYVEIAQAQAATGDLTGAKVTTAQIPANLVNGTDMNGWLKARAYRSIAAASVKAGDLAGAKSFAAQIPDQGDREEFYDEFTFSLANAGNFAEAKLTAEKIQQSRSKDDAYTSIAQAQSKAGDAAGARLTAGNVQDPDTKAFAIALVQAEAGDVTSAVNTIAQATEDPRKQCDMYGAAAERLLRVHGVLDAHTED